MVKTKDGHFEVIEYLVSIRAILIDKDNGGNAPLDYAKESK